jgi:hypothetical protein
MACVVFFRRAHGEIDSISQLIAMFVDRSADNAGEKPVAPIDVAVWLSGKVPQRKSRK